MCGLRLTRCSAHDTSSGRGAAKRMDLPTAIEVVARAHTSSQWKFRERGRNSIFYRRCFYRNTGKDNAYAAVYSRFAELLGLPTKLFGHTWAAFLPVEGNVSAPHFVAFRDVRREDGGLPQRSMCDLQLRMPLAVCKLSVCSGSKHRFSSAVSEQLSPGICSRPTLLLGPRWTPPAPCLVR